MAPLIPLLKKYVVGELVSYVGKKFKKEIVQDDAAPSSRHHDLKLDDFWYPSAESQEKMFEIRKNDRDFRIGDTITLNRWNSITSEYMGESLERVVTFMTDYLQQPGYVVLGLKEK